jgi:hypothetical protein
MSLAYRRADSDHYYSLADYRPRISAGFPFITRSAAMTDTVVIAEQNASPSGFRFSWGLAIGGGVLATAVTFILLTLGAGFGLLLAGPHHGVSVPTLFTGGAIYFFVAQAFGFAVGGHFAGRLLGPLIETQMQEDIRAGAHALVAWAIAILASFTLFVFAGLAASDHTANLYGSGNSTSQPTAYIVDTLFRNGGNSDALAPRAEAGRIIDADMANGVDLTSQDHDRLVGLVSRETGLSHDAATQRVDTMQSDLLTKTNVARKSASYISLWIALSLLFGAVVAVGAAVSARIEDDRQAPLASASR